MTEKILQALDYTLGLTADQVAAECGISRFEAEQGLSDLQKAGLAYQQKLNLERRWFRAQHGGYAA